MITNATARSIRVIVLTPTPVLGAKLDDPIDPLNQQAGQVRKLARECGVGLVDSFLLRSSGRCDMGQSFLN
jgi:hypothetical protein